MEFRFEDKITAWDVWKLSMYHVYHSLAGVCNIIFTVAVILLFGKFWNIMESWQAGIVILGCLLFPVIQPAVIYKRACGQVAALPKDMEYEINDTGIHITAGNQKAHVSWNRVRGISKEYGMIILAIEDGRGYMLTDKTLGTQKAAFLEYLEAKTEHKS